MITRLAVAGYRSLRDLRIELGPLTLVTGANGSGKSSLYRSLRLLADIAQGRIIRSLAEEGGLPSTLWAGPESYSRGMKAGTTPVQGTVRTNPIRLKLGFSGPDYGYAAELGLPPPIPPSAFFLDPEIKQEAIWTGETIRRSNVFAKREGRSVRIRDAEGVWQQIATGLPAVDSMMTHCAEPQAASELLDLRERMRAWRFYDHLRTDRDAPARRPQVGTYTPALSDDGSDVAAALQTIREIGDERELDHRIDDAFPGARIEISHERAHFDLVMHQRGLLRPLGAAELSDGTLRYILLVAALLSPRPAPLTVLNEPETSLHPDLLEPLARLIGAASLNGQVVVVTHARRLVEALAAHAPCRRLDLSKRLGETIAGEDERASWTWP
ncbi:AAA family ATPase [Enterovirga rhinocerotis]|uniref:Putative ATPase n=1 Tax=Enterovirga rhinocerotis TaxID=1339210 RepID=A0A4R7BYR5_9HYPH|nr:AAA family ATPase [Enterovirga rhinocerotis]TDR90412.1 putative ATPase [Enterovirga rhinocerotis]